jgi:nucleoside-diphosphate-sugar epimerase
MKRIVVTGGSGLAGSVVIRDLVEHGYEVLNVDRLPPRERYAPFLTIDLTDQGQVFEALWKADGVVHLAAVPAPGIITDEHTFRNNTNSTFNVFNAAMKQGLQRVIWASSLRVVGVPFRDGVVPSYLPIDEEHPYLPDSSYSLSKVISEEMARQFHFWSGIPFVGLRFSRIIGPENYPDYLARKQRNDFLWKELWSYVDARDAAQAIRLSLETPLQGAEVFNITAADCAIERVSPALLECYYPDTPKRSDLKETESLFSIKKACEKLGYAPRYSWRDHM